MQPARLEQDWNSCKCNNGVHLLPVEFNDVACLPFDVRTTYKLHIFAQRLSGPPQHILFFGIVQIVDVAGVHIHGVHQSGAMRGAQMILKGFDADSAIRFKRQKRRGDALHLAAEHLPLNDRFDFHRLAFAIFSRSANSEIL